MRILIITLLATTLVLLVSSVLLAQPPGFPFGPSGPSQSPIDGGLVVLAAAGGAYAWKKLRAKED